MLGSRFRVFPDGRVNKIVDGVEVPAHIILYGRNKQYEAVTYRDNGKQKTAYVHRLVAAAFVPNPDKFPQVNHIDGNPRNNSASNLAWVTRSYTTRHAYDSGQTNPMATATPCTCCGDFTKAKDGICPKCKQMLKIEAGEIDRRAKQADRYSQIDVSLLTDTEKKYVNHAANGMSVAEIAQLYSVSKQCVSAALLWAEKKSISGRKLPRNIEDRRISLINRLDRKRKKLEYATAALKVAKSGYEGVKAALEELEGYIQETFKTQQ